MIVKKDLESNTCFISNYVYIVIIIMVYMFIAVKIDSSLCYSAEQRQISESTFCSPYDYRNLSTLITQVNNLLIHIIQFICVTKISTRFVKQIH